MEGVQTMSSSIAQDSCSIGPVLLILEMPLESVVE